MNRCFEFTLNQPGLEKTRFLVWRKALSTNGDVESDFLSDIRDLRRHAPGVTISQAMRTALTAPSTATLVVIRNPDIVLDPDLPQRVAKALGTLPSPDVWSIAASGGLGVAEQRHLALYATASPALPDTGGMHALLDLMPDLYIVNAAFAARLITTWPSVPEAALEPVLTVEGYLSGRIALFCPQLTAGINGDLVARDLGRLSTEVDAHFAGRFPDQSISTLSGTIKIGRSKASPVIDTETAPASSWISEAIDETLKSHADAFSLSIIVRTRFDRLHLLERLLTSLSRTRVEGIDLEVVLSSDEDIAVCRAETQRLQADFRSLAIRLKHNSPQGHSRVNNLLGGIDAARADYVMLIDDDDYVDLFAFETLSKSLFLGNRPLIVTGSEVHEELWEATPSGRWVLTQNAVKSRYPSSGWREMFSGVNRLPICAFIMPRKQLQDRIGAFPFRHDLSEDYALFLLVLTDNQLPGLFEVPDIVCHISVRGQENSVSMPDRRPWIRDITGFLSDLTSDLKVAGPGVWTLLAAKTKRKDDCIDGRSVSDLRQALDRAQDNIALLRRENARLRRVHTSSGEAAK